MKSALALSLVLFCSGSVFAADLECVSTIPEFSVNLQAEVSSDGLVYENIQFEIIENGHVNTSKSFPAAVYDSSYKPRGTNVDRIAFRVMKNESLRTNYTFFRPKNINGKFLATLGESNAGYHGDTEYYFLTCTQK